MSKQLRLDVAQLTDVGRKRPHNEDNMAYVIPKDSQVMAKKGALFIVADGMGGHAAGEVASEIAVDTVSNVYYQDENDNIPLSLMNAIKRANALIHQRAAENMLRSGMGTTCVAAVICGSVAYIANVGDSRAYVVRNGQSRQISQDHSWVEEQVRAGLLTKDQARSHAQRNVITRCLGTQADVEVDVFTENLQEGDTFILCSDGLSGYIVEEDLRSIISQYMPQESVYHLVERANENGGPDNITAIVARVLEFGDESPDALYPVHAGSASYSADEQTVPLGSLSSSSLSAATPLRSEGGRRQSTASPFPSPEPQFSSANNVAASKAAVVSPRRKRRRLLVPTIAICFLLLMALTGTGYYFFVRISSGQMTLDQANDLIGQSQSVLASNPTLALQDLSRAQTQLQTLKPGNLSPQQSTQFQQLQSRLVSNVQQAVTNYNRQAAISALPCKTSAPIALTAPNSAGLQFSTVVQTTDQKGHVLTYTLGSDGKLYQVADNHQITNVNVTTDKIIAVASGAQQVYALTVAQQQGGLNYKLHVYKPEQNGKMGEDNANGMPISAVFINGQTPQLLAASNKDIYVISTSQYQATILHYNADKPGDDPQKTAISISSGLISATALANNQLFLLHSDGHIKALQLDSATTPVESDLVVKGTIHTPWPVDAQSFTASTSLTSPAADITKFLVVPVSSSQQSLSLLAATQINNASHLYIVDNTNHRVLDLLVTGNGATSSGSTNTATPAATATSNVGGNVIGSSATSVQLVQQYASPQVLPMVSAITLASNANRLNLLTEGKGTASVSQVMIDVSNSTACAQTP